MIPRPKIVAWESWLSLFSNIYSYATILAPAMLMAPRYFSGEIRVGTISQVTFAFHRIEVRWLLPGVGGASFFPVGWKPQ